MSQPYDPNQYPPPPGPPGYPPPPSAFPPPSMTGNGRVPADHGLSGLGLVMQLAGTIFSGVAGTFGLMMVILMVRVGAAGGGGGGSATMWMLLIIGASFVRSLLHRAAGARLLYDGPSNPLQAIRRYLIAAAVQIGVVLAFLMTQPGSMPGSILLSIIIMLGGWPLTLLILFSLPQYKQIEHGVPVSEDKGFEGASIMMVLLGLMGLGAGLVMLYTFLQMPSGALSQLPGIMSLLIVIMLVIRSGLHVQAGWRGVTEVHMDRAVEAATRYANFGVLTAFCAAGGMMLMLMTMGGAGAMDPTILLMLSMVLLLLLAWPLIIRKFFAERQFADILSGASTSSHRRAVDLGHTTLGWFLLALGIYELSMNLPRAALLPNMGGGGMGRGGGGNPMAMLFGMMSEGPSLRSPWWTVGGAALQAWAGLELIRMSDGHKLIASIYGVVATAVAVYVNLPVFEAFKHAGVGGLLGGGGPEVGIMVGGVVIALVVPVGTLILVNRKPK